MLPEAQRTANHPARCCHAAAATAAAASAPWCHRHDAAATERHWTPPTAPVCCVPAVEAGTVWREEKLRDFVFRLRCLGLEGDPQFAALAAQIAEATSALDELAEAQRRPEYQRPWWQDGEYDGARADRCGLAGRGQGGGRAGAGRGQGRGSECHAVVWEQAGKQAQQAGWKA